MEIHVPFEAAQFLTPLLKEILWEFSATSWPSWALAMTR